MIGLARNTSRRKTMYALLAKLRQVRRLLDGRVAAADDDKRLTGNRGSAPSQTAHAETPRFLKRSSEASPK